MYTVMLYTSKFLGFTTLGGNALFLGPDDIHFGVNETIQDSAR